LLKLNFGSGGVEIPGYISVDKYDQRASIKMDVFKFDLLLDNTIDEILSSHMLEHINPYKVSDLLRKWFGLLKPGGKLILEMPDIVETCKAMVTAKDKWERYGLINTIFGSVNTTNNDDPSSITAPHLFGWYNEILYDHLAEIGFVDIQFMPEQFPHPGHNFRTECRKP
jgi:SAM-dependent methyltransferase